MTRLCMLVTFLFVAGACSAGEGNSVAMVDGQRFSPETLTVEAGTTVEFVNRSSQAHTVTAYTDGIPDHTEYFASGGLPSEEAARAEPGKGLLAAGESYSITFDEPGTYSYFCLPHEQDSMTGKIIVED